LLMEAEVVDIALEISMLLIAYVRDGNGKLYPPLAQIAVREAKYLSNLIPKHFVANGDTDASPLSTDEKFEYTIKV